MLRALIVSLASLWLMLSCTIFSVKSLNCSLSDSVAVLDPFVYIEPDQGKIFHRGVVYSVGQYDMVNVAIDVNGSEINVPPYPRVCICNLIPCIRIVACDVSHEVFNEDYCQPFDVWNILITHQILDASGAEVRVVLNNQFGIVTDRICTNYQRVHKYNLYYVSLN